MLGCNSLFYYPNAHCYGKPEQMRLKYESVTFAAPGGPRLHGWFFPASREISASCPHPGPPASTRERVEMHAPGGLPRPVSLGEPCDPDRAIPLRAHGTVLHLHGNAGNITGHFQHVAWLPAAGWNVLCFDYRGYGRSEGRMSRAGGIADAHAALDYVLARDDVDASRVVAFGQSLGGAIGIVLAAERPEVRGLAVDGAFDNYRRIVGWHIRRSPLLLPIAWWVPPVLVANGYEPIEYVARIAPRPVFIMHGMADRVVDPAMARRLYDAARDPKELWLVPDADHYGAMQDEAGEAHARLTTFFGRAVNVESE